MKGTLITTVGEVVAFEECDHFRGEWAKRYVKNLPGPFYSTSDNLMSLLSSTRASNFILFDQKCEFFWRQPLSKLDISDCLLAMTYDEASSYQIDGNQHWTVEAVKDWWQFKSQFIEWAKLEQAKPSKKEPGWSVVDKRWKTVSCQDNRQSMTKYLDFMNNGAELYLRKYMFLLLNNKVAGINDTLPELS